MACLNVTSPSYAFPCRSCSGSCNTLLASLSTRHGASTLATDAVIAGLPVRGAEDMMSVEADTKSRTSWANSFPPSAVNFDQPE